MSNENSLLAELEELPDCCREAVIRVINKCAERGYNDFRQLPTGPYLKERLRKRSRKNIENLQMP